SQLFSPPLISRNECARTNWQNIIATNWLQLLSPFAARSAPVSLTSFSNSSRGMSLSISLNMLHDAFTWGLRDQCQALMGLAIHQHPTPADGPASGNCFGQVCCYIYVLRQWITQCIAP